MAAFCVDAEQWFCVGGADIKTPCRKMHVEAVGMIDENGILFIDAFKFFQKLLGIGALAIDLSAAGEGLYAFGDKIVER